MWAHNKAVVYEIGFIWGFQGFEKHLDISRTVQTIDKKGRTKTCMWHLNLSLFHKSWGLNTCCLSAGALVDMFGDYSYMFYMCGAVLLTAGLFLFAMNYYNYRRKNAVRRTQENGAELADRNLQNELMHEDSRTSDGQSQGVGSGTPGGRLSETEDIPV